MKKIYLIQHIVITVFSLIFLNLNIWDLLNAKFVYSIILICYNGLNAALGIFLHIKNCRNKERIGIGWYISVVPILIYGVLFSLQNIQWFLNYLSQGVFDWFFFSLLIITILTTLGQILWQKEMILLYNSGTFLKIYFAIICPIIVIMPGFYFLSIMFW